MLQVSSKDLIVVGANMKLIDTRANQSHLSLLGTRYNHIIVALLLRVS